MHQNRTTPRNSRITAEHRRKKRSLKEQTIKICFPYGAMTENSSHLLSGQVVTVKKFEVSQAGELAHLKSFAKRESLKKILSNEKEAVDFEWIKRVNVIKGVANGLSYKHHECLPPIIHQDISSKNVLLDGEYVAHISDFGTARFLKPDSYYWTSFAGTIGYAAPELAYTMEVNERLDVYSLGAISSLHSSSPPTTYGILLKDILDILSKDILDSCLPPPRTSGKRSGPGCKTSIGMFAH
ncbi:hypothetical protein ACSBR1_001062 [Camellia fascicularis]